MIADRDTNQVFVSEWLPKVHPAILQPFFRVTEEYPHQYGSVIKHSRYLVS
jgi:hypothetical protein